jgi:hypothetical protein
MPGIGEVNELMNRAAQEADADRFAGSSQHQ